jgi:hypothetical protein
LTFTKRPPRDKQRIRDRLRELHLLEEASAVDRAYIMTLELTPDPIPAIISIGVGTRRRILDEQILNLLSKRALSSSLMRYESRDLGFLRLVNPIRSDLTMPGNLVWP